ncbi:hypothetical protein Q8W71_18810 [Methylobacterium sp. NEAU 140]|uniref:hypothetical protein n=1 Tax=Methylobacterium sp. NEAU 140 TaxID=3064945 RepID=UPI002732AE23|nr:hypothetical protein [Methylobacterium sp. NEAU 140]MDP4024682.1 hypothetical protein [Methylobacterium sp. NEAU 140]
MPQRRVTSALHRAGLCAWLVAQSAAAQSPGTGAILERLQAERRTVLAYLARDNADLALTALDRWRARLRSEGRTLTAAADSTALRPILDALDAALTEATQALEGGDGARAAGIVETALAPLDAWRRSGGLRLFSDCVTDLSGRYGALDRYRHAAPDLEDAAVRTRIGTAAADALAAVNRCDAEAGASIRSDPEFRRLADGMSASLGKVPTALDSRDPGLLHRLLIELRAFERLLAFRYG